MVRLPVRVEHVRVHFDGGSRESQASGGFCVEAWCDVRGTCVDIVEVGLFLGPGDSMYAECVAGIQALLAGVSALKNRCVLLRRNCMLD